MKFLFALLVPLAVSAASVGVTWDPATDQSITGYIVRFGPSSSNKVQTVNVGQTNLVRISGIPDNIQVYMDVVSYNAIGIQSLPSNEITFNTTPPPPPKALRLTNNSVVVTVTVQGQ